MDPLAPRVAARFSAKPPYTKAELEEAIVIIERTMRDGPKHIEGLKRAIRFLEKGEDPNPILRHLPLPVWEWFRK
jgi:hypothetical protein